LSPPRPTPKFPKLVDYPLSAARDCLCYIFAATLLIGGRCSTRNLRTPYAVVTGSHLFRSLYNVIQNFELCVRLVKFHVVVLLFVVPRGSEYGYKDLAANKYEEGCKLLRNACTICRTVCCLKAETSNICTQCFPHIYCAALRVSCPHTWLKNCSSCRQCPLFLTLNNTC